MLRVLCDSPIVVQVFCLIVAVFLSTGVCLIMAESSGNTAAKGGPNSNGSYDYGLFQVSKTRHLSHCAVLGHSNTGVASLNLACSTD
jgi:hypothetical protein